VVFANQGQDIAGGQRFHASSRQMRPNPV